MFNTKNKNIGQDEAKGLSPHPQPLSHGERVAEGRVREAVDSGLSPARKRNSGQVLVLVALSLVVFIGFAALAIDVAYFYHTRHQLQGAADAAALAGVAELDWSTSTNQLTARQAAWKFACKNSAAGQSVYVVKKDTGNCDVPPSSGLNESSNDPTGDIVLGNWDNTRPQGAKDCDDERFLPAVKCDGAIVPLATGTLINAVKVRPRRTGDTLGMPKVNTFFGRIFGRSTVNISAKAIAMKVPGSVAPIAANEYWYGDSGASQPYGSDYTGPVALRHYPNSFFRFRNLTTGSSPGSFSTNWGSPSGYPECQGKILAIAGANANPNNTSSDPGGFIALDYRVNSYEGKTGENWYKMPDTSTSIPAGQVKPKKAEWAPYLDSYPYLPPIVIQERRIQNYDTNNPVIPYTSPGTSGPTYATIAYLEGIAVGQFTAEMIDDGNYRNHRYEPGKDIVVLVYDGLRQAKGNTNKRVTAVGYAKVRIIGYGNSIDGAKANPTNKNGNTAYGCAREQLFQCYTAAVCQEQINRWTPPRARLVQ